MKKKIFTTGLAIALFLTSGVVNAKEIKGPDKSKESKVLEVLAEGNDVQTKNNYAISPHIHGTCVHCGQWCYTVCAADGEIGDSWTHDTLLTKDCKVTILRSRGATMCGSCSYVNEQHGYHDCWEVHTKCSKGRYDVCPMDIS